MNIYHNFVFIIPTYNTEHVYEKCLSSVLNQTYTKWRIIYIDDASTDNTYDKVSQYIQDNKIEKKVKLIRNEKNMKPGYSRYIAFQLCDDDEICCLLDGDDWLYDKSVLNKLNNFYNNNDVLVTYGSMCCYKNNKLITYKVPDYSEDCIKGKKYRIVKWTCEQLRTGFARLFKNIPIEQQQDTNGDWLKYSTDRSVMYSVLEQSNGKHKKVDFMTYIYNVDNANLYQTGPGHKEGNKLTPGRIIIQNHLKSFYIGNNEGPKTELDIKEHNIYIDTQNEFYKYLQDNKIKQIDLDLNLYKFYKIQKLYKLDSYSNKKDPCLFFGVYTQKRAMSLWCHKGVKYIMFGGSDCDTQIKESKNVMKFLKTLKNTVFISISKDIYDRLNILGIVSIYIPLDMTEYEYT